jgi:hypothetical protein
MSEPGVNDQQSEEEGFGPAMRRLRERRLRRQRELGLQADEVACKRCGAPMPRGRLVNAGFSVCGPCNRVVYPGRVEVGMARLRGKRVLGG